MPRLSKENKLLAELPQLDSLRSLKSKNKALADAQALHNKYPQYYRIKVRMQQYATLLKTSDGRQITIYDILD